MKSLPKLFDALCRDLDSFLSLNGEAQWTCTDGACLGNLGTGGYGLP
ncbi:MAG: hypothetical protein JW950_02675 [Deltaproteobacteria bacterium]|nr:hypothetical protein [Deltaproteobacteria bacterium]